MNILGRLPSTSQYVTAQRMDPEYGDWLASQPEPARKWTPQPQEWGLDRELLAGLIDRVGDLITVTVNQHAKKPVKPPPRFPRPVTAIEKAKARAERRIEHELDALVAAAHATYAAEHAQDGG